MTDAALPQDAAFAGMRVLVLEDNAVERALLAATLARLGVGRVEQAAGCAAALALVTAQPAFDVILCDLQMQTDAGDRMDGVEFLRVAAHRLHCPVVLVSGVDDDLAGAAETLAVANGAAWGGRLREPVVAAELRAILAACAATPAAAASTATAARRWSLPDLRRALARGEFVPWFQPQQCLATGRLVGVEALARWVQPDGTVIGADEFVPAMEGAGMIDALFDAMLDRSLDALAAWAAAGRSVPVSLNASPLTLENVDVPDRWRARVQARGIDPGQITIEVTETAVARNFHGLLETVTRLRMHGFRVALDDFGTSHSSLQQMSELPATEVKIDRSFVERALRNPRARVIVEGIVQLGRKLDMKVVAEGVETQAQSDFLRAIGCDAAQGWFHGRPTPAEAAPPAPAMQRPSPAVADGAATMRDDTIQHHFNCANPTGMIDRLIDMKRLRNDAELSRLLGVAPPTISKIRSGKTAVSAAVVLRIHEIFGLPIAELRELMGAV